MTVPDHDGAKALRRAVYYATKGIRTAYNQYHGDYEHLLEEALEVLADLYAALKVEESSQHE